MIQPTDTVLIGEDNAPSLRQLESLGRNAPSRQFICQPDPGRYYAVSFASKSQSIFDALKAAQDHEINNAIVGIAAIINGGGVDRLDTCTSGNAVRELEIPTQERHCSTLAYVTVTTAEPFSIDAPSDAELRQLFNFLCRCHPLA
jgi:hypothetical protein